MFKLTSIAQNLFKAMYSELETVRLCLLQKTVSSYNQAIPSIGLAQLYNSADTQCAILHK